MWSGGGPGSNWTTAGNWSTGVPSTLATSTQTIDFTGATGLTPAMNGAYHAGILEFDASATGAFNVKEGNNTLTLQGATPTIDQLSSSNQTVSGGTVAFSSGGLIDVGGTGSLTISSLITGTGTLTIQSTGTLILSGANTGYTGPLVLTTGMLQASTSASALGTGLVTVDSGSTLNLTGTLTYANALNLNGTGVGGVGALEKTAAGTTTVSGPIALAGNTTIGSAAGTLVLGTGGITGTNTNLTLNGAGALSVTDKIATGSGTVTLSGTGTTTFAGTTANTYTGVTTVNSGTLALDAAATAVDGNLTVNGGTVTDTLSNQIATTSNLTLDGGTLKLNANTEQVASLAGITGATLAIGTGALTISGASTTSFGGAITGSGTINKSGSGTLDLTGATQAFTGTWNLSSGILNAGAANATGTGNSTVAVSGTGDLQVQGGVTLADKLNLSTLGGGNGAVENVSGSNIISGAVTISGTSAIESDAGTLTLSGALGVGTSTLTFQGSGNTTLSGGVTGSGAVDMTGNGTLSLTKANSSFTGTWNESNGILNASAANATGAATSTVAVTGTGDFQVQGGVSNQSLLHLSTLGNGSGAIESVTGTNTLTGAMTVSGNSTIQADSGTLTASGAIGLGANTLNVAGAGNTTLSGLITGTSASALKMNGTGTLTVSKSNTGFLGTVTVTSGTLQTGIANAFTSSTAITVNTGAIMNLNNLSQNIGSLQDAGTLAFGTGATLTLSSGSSMLNGLLTGSGTLVLGTGSTLTLGANFSDTNLNITLAGGTLDLIGKTDTFGNLSVTSTSIIDFGGAAGSVLSVNKVTASAGVTLNVNNWSNYVDFFYSVTSPGSQGTAPIDQINFDGLGGALTHWNAYTDGPGPGHQITPAPEPATFGAVLVGLTLAAIGVYRRRRVGGD
jgi:autotransporter-associated beta strand protein